LYYKRYKNIFFKDGVSPAHCTVTTTTGSGLNHGKQNRKNNF